MDIEKLGITPSPWELTHVEEDYNSIGYKFDNGSSYKVVDNVQDCDVKILCATPDLFESLVNTNLKICKLMDTHNCGDLEKMLMPIFSDNCESLKKATGLDWEKLKETLCL